MNQERNISTFNPNHMKRFSIEPLNSTPHHGPRRDEMRQIVAVVIDGMFEMILMFVWPRAKSKKAGSFVAANRAAQRE
jgi:hypothetical protein